LPVAWNGPTHADPRWVLALFYAAQFGHLGIVLPFLAPWIEGRGFGPMGIGVLMALPALFKVASPWSWGVWADRSGKRRELLALATLAAAVSLTVLPLAPGLFWIGLLVGVNAFVRAPIIPYVETTALEQSEHRGFAYGPIRLWGSIAFMVTSAGYGWMRGTGTGDAGLVLAGGMMAAAGLLAKFAFPRPLGRPGEREAVTSAQGGEAAAARPADLVRLLAGCALMQVSHGAYYTFYSIHLQNLGYGGTAIGLLWALGVFCEILLLTRVDRVVNRYGSGVVLQASLLVAAVRWILIGTVTSLPWLALAQTLHAVTYAAFHVAAIRDVYHLFGSRARARGQTMYSGMTYGLGMSVGSLGAGWLGAMIGLPSLFLVSAGVALCAMPVLGGRLFRGARAEATSEQRG
jgi:PPP family 3-phenylpropionic acid transporter